MEEGKSGINVLNNYPGSSFRIWGRCPCVAGGEGWLLICHENNWIQYLWIYKLLKHKTYET
jgi:hypothetical protein